MKSSILAIMATSCLCLASAQAELTTEHFIKDGKPVKMERTGDFKQQDGRVWLIAKKNQKLPPEWGGMALGKGNNIMEAQLQFHRRSDLYGKGVPSEAAVHFGKRTLILDGGETGDIILREKGKEDILVGKTADYIKMKTLFKLKIARINGELIIKINNKDVGKYNVKHDKGAAIGKVGLACNKSVMQVVNFSARSQNFAVVSQTPNQ